MNDRLLICFDWDGTLADSMDLCVREIELGLRRMGLPPRPLAEMRACNGPTYAQSVEILHIPEGLGEEFLRRRSAAELEVIPECQKLFPGIRELLADLREVADLAIVSNGLPEYLKASGELLGVTSFFVRTEALKPGRTKAQALAEVLEEAGHPRAVMVGDRLGDFEAGRANRIPTVAACYGYGNEEEWRAADHRAASVEELRKLLRGMAVS